MRSSCIALAVMAACSAFAAEPDPVKTLGLVSPVSVTSCDQVADAGSIHCVLRDAKGVVYHVFVEHKWRADTARRWFVGADHSRGLPAEQLADDDPRKDIIRQVVVDWVDSLVSEEEQALMAARPYADVDPREMTREAMILETAKWTAVKFFKGGQL